MLILLKKQSSGKSGGDRHDKQYTHGGKNRFKNPNQRAGAEKRKNKGNRGHVNRKSMIEEILNLALSNNKLVGIRTYNENWEDVIIGFVKEIRDTELIIEEISELGEICGELIIDIEKIINLDYDDMYQKKLEFLFSIKKESFDKSQLTVLKEGKLLISYFKELIENEYICKFYFDDNHFELGILKKFTNEFILCENTGLNGQYEGLSCFRIDNLVGLKFRSKELLKLKILYNKLR